MKQNEVQATFESLVQELADPSQQVPISKLVGLSGISAGGGSSFERAWLEMDGLRRQRLIQELIDLAEDSVELNFDTVFLLALRDQRADVRRAAIQGLSEYEGRDLIQPLTVLLRSDPDPGVRAEAALALGRFVLRAELAALRSSDAERIEGALRQTFTDPTEPLEVRARALEGLGARSEDWVHDLIEDAFSSDDRRLRISAVHAMGRSADTAWLSSVLGQLDSDDAEMRFEAVVAAGSIEDPEATPYLVALLHDDDTEVQEAAINALGQIGGDDAKEALQELLSEGDERIAEAVTYALAEIDFADDPLALDLPELL